MILWTFDTATRELVYTDPETRQTFHYALEVIAQEGDLRATEVALRNSLPRTNRANILRVR